MNKDQAFKEIEDTQEYYVNKLINTILDEHNICLKTINFTSPTGTGKTRMMAMLCNKMSDCYFVITTLSKGQLHLQIRNNMSQIAIHNNFVVYGLCDYTSNTKRTAFDIMTLLPETKKIIWLRDEGHINTNKWQELLSNVCFKVINFSATNKEDTGIKCNFTNTMMLRTVHQSIGTPEDALDKLLEIKEQHKNVKKYNPCAIMRCLDSTIESQVIKACEERGLEYINITTEDFDMSDLCKDDNKYDVILNKFKIVEGIDIRRAHVLYMTNEPSNPSTTIQVIGRCRRNALLYRDDVDLFAKSNKKLLDATRQCFVFYNIENMNIEQDENGELCQEFCDTISCQELKADSIIHVENGQMDNGLKIFELEKESGNYKVEVDPATGFNIVKPEGNFYGTKQRIVKPEAVTLFGYTKSELFDSVKFPVKHEFNYATGTFDGEEYIEVTPHVVLNLRLRQDAHNALKQYGKKEYRMETRFCEKSVVVDIYKLKSYITVESAVYKNLYNLVAYIETFDIESLTQTKRFKTQEKADAFIASYYNPSRNIKRFKIKCYSTYKQDNFMTRIHKVKWYHRVISSKEINYEVSSFNDVDDIILPIDIEENTKHIAITRLIKEFDSLERQFVPYYEYKQIVNDRESAIIGVDRLKRIKTSLDAIIWTEDKAVTGKLSRYSKFNTFIQNRYEKEILQAKEHCFGGKNKFNFNSKCNSCLGYCVEYYSKYLVYGHKYLGKFLDEAKSESKASELNDFLIVRACMLKYKDNMKKAYGNNIEKVIKTISVEQLVKDNYREFVNTILQLGAKTAEFVKNKLNILEPLEDGDSLFDPNLSIDHIAGLADYINEDTIIDIKTTNSINLAHIKQVLAYHYLSTKRTDLNIKHVIVYDCVSDKYVQIDL